MDKVIKGLEYLEPKMPFLDVIKVYNHFKDKYTEKHFHKYLENDNAKEYIKKRNDVFLRYCQIYYNTEAIIKRELKDW